MILPLLAPMQFIALSQTPCICGNFRVRTADALAEHLWRLFQCPLPYSSRLGPPPGCWWAWQVRRAPGRSSILTLQPFVDDTLVGSGRCSQAMIIGLDGSIWAATAGLSVEPEEVAALFAEFEGGSLTPRSILTCDALLQHAAQSSTQLYLVHLRPELRLFVDRLLHPPMPPSDTHILRMGSFPFHNCNRLLCPPRVTGFCAAKTNRCVIVGFFSESIQVSRAAVAVKDLSDYIIQNGY